MKPSVHNIDAQHGGQCTVLTTVSAEYTLPPLAASDRTSGFDGVILLDAGMTREKSALARDCAVAMVDATGSNDRLALVTMATKDADAGAVVVSELIMCTTPYKQALQESIRQVTGENGTADLVEAMGLAVGLLGADARYGGHIFVISDGNAFTQNMDGDMGFWREAPCLVHCIAVGGLVHMSTLRRIRTREGCLMDFRDTQRDIAKISSLIGYLATNVHSAPIETLRCRFAYAQDKLSITETYTHPSFPSDSSSVTISPLPHPLTLSRN